MALAGVDETMGTTPAAAIRSAAARRTLRRSRCGRVEGTLAMGCSSGHGATQWRHHEREHIEQSMSICALSACPFGRTGDHHSTRAAPPGRDRHVTSTVACAWLNPPPPPRAGAYARPYTSRPGR